MPKSCYIPSANFVFCCCNETSIVKGNKKIVVFIRGVLLVISVNFVTLDKARKFLLGFYRVDIVIAVIVKGEFQYEHLIA